MQREGSKRLGDPVRPRAAGLKLGWGAGKMVVPENGSHPMGGSSSLGGLGCMESPLSPDDPNAAALLNLH